jgi:hypothetical protein
MSTDVVVKPNRNIPAEYKRLFGPPPLYKVEDETYYNATLCGFDQDVNPRDHVEKILVRDLADQAYEIQWWRRLRNRVMRQVHKEEFRRRAGDVVHAADIRKRSLRGSDDFASFFGTKQVPDPNQRTPEAEATLNAEIQKIDAETEATLAELRQAEHGPIDEAALFRNWIPLHDLIEKRLTVAEEKFAMALTQLEQHRDGLGQLLRRVAETIIDIEPAVDPARAREALPGPEEPR